MDVFRVRQRQTENVSPLLVCFKMLSFGMFCTILNLAFSPMRYSPRSLKGLYGVSTVHDRGMFIHSSKQTLGGTVRLDRILSNRGIGSRKEALTRIKQGRVRVDGIVVKAPSQKFPVDSSITIDGQKVNTVPLLMAFHKPLNILSSMGDPMGRPSLLEVVPKEWAQCGLHPVGRLGNSTLLTNLVVAGCLIVLFRIIHCVIL
jgi:hypothetical protein